MQPEKERSGLLLPDRPDGAGGRRRPADIFVPSYLGSPTAFDLAITGPQRQETLAEVGRKSLAAATSYAKVKMTHLNTFEECAAHRACASRPWLLRQRVPGNQWQPLCCSNWRVRSRQGRTATGTFSTANSYKNSPSRFGVGELVPLFGGALNWSSPHGRFLLRLLLLRTF